MNTDQQELATYQRAVETAKNEIADLRRRLAQSEADAAALRAALEAVQSFVQDRGIRSSRAAWTQMRAVLATDRPGAAILAVAEAARAYVHAGDYDDLASLLLDLKDKVARWER